MWQLAENATDCSSSYSIPLPNSPASREISRRIARPNIHQVGPTLQIYPILIDKRSTRRSICLKREESCSMEGGKCSPGFFESFERAVSEIRRKTLAKNAAGVGTSRDGYCRTRLALLSWEMSPVSLCHVIQSSSGLIRPQVDGFTSRDVGTYLCRIVAPNRLLWNS